MLKLDLLGELDGLVGFLESLAELGESEGILLEGVGCLFCLLGRSALWGG